MHILEGVQAWRLPVIFWIWVFFVDFPLKHHRNVNIKKCDKSGCTPFRLHIDRGCIVGILHSPSKCLAWVKKCCHVWLDQNFDPSLLTNKLWHNHFSGYIWVYCIGIWKLNIKEVRKVFKNFFTLIDLFPIKGIQYHCDQWLLPVPQTRNSNYKINIKLDKQLFTGSKI